MTLDDDTTTTSNDGGADSGAGHGAADGGPEAAIGFQPQGTFRHTRASQAAAAR